MRHQPLHDPKILRAIAHPVRNRILGELDARGPMRAADIARELGIPANQASFHLRQLAKYGLVEEDPTAARDRRDRVWKPTSPAGYAVDLKAVEEAPGGKAASAVFRRSASAWGHLVVDRVYSRDRVKGTLTSLTETALLLGRDEAEQFVAELGEVVERWTERTREAGGDRRTYLYYAAVLPYPDVERVEPGQD